MKLIQNRLIPLTLMAAALVTAGCASSPPAKPTYPDVASFAADLPHIDYTTMQPTRIGGKRYLGSHVNGRADCPTYVTIRLSDNQFRHWRVCPNQVPEEYRPKVRPFPDTVEAEFMVEQEMENLFVDRRYFIKVKNWKDYKIVSLRADWDFDKDGCQRMHGFVYDTDDKKNNIGLVYFREEKLCKDS